MNRIAQAALLFLVLLMSYARIAQGQDIRPGEGNVRNIRTVVKEHGWKIPGLDESVITQPRQRHERPAYQGLEIYRTRFTPQHRYEESIIEYEVTTQLPFYSINQTGVLTLEEQTHRIEDIDRYDFRGKPYCFRVTTILMGYNPHNQTGGYSRLLSVDYLDMDGDGKFETMIPFSPESPRLPGWVTAEAAGEK